MKLKEDQLNFLFKTYLDEYVIPGSKDHLPVFENFDNGAILTRRLKKVLRDKKYSYISTSTAIDVVELSFIAQEFFKIHPKIFIQGLNHWATITDLKVLINIYNKYFGK